MQGTWIEATVFGTVFAEATIPESNEPVTTNITTNATNAALFIRSEDLYAEKSAPASLWFMKKLI